MASYLLTDDVFISLYFVCSAGIIANFLLLVALIRDPLKCFRNSSTYLIGNLCVSDMTLQVFILLKVCIHHASVDFMIYALFYSSMLTIFSIAVDRYMITVHPFKHRIWMSGKKSALWICSNWILCTIHPIERAIFGYKSYDMRAKCSIALMLIALSFIVYAKTYLTLRKEAKMMNDNLSGLSAERMHRSKCVSNIRRAREQKFLTTIVIIACIALVTISPSLLHRQVYRHSQLLIESGKDSLIQKILVTIMCVNFAANPFIYYFRLEKYRKTFKKLYGCK